MTLVTYSNWPACSRTEYLPSTITVLEGARKLIGVNADTDSLKFGKVSPGAEITRSVKINAAKDSEITVVMLGNFTSWVSITPAQFHLPSRNTQKINFDVIVPPNAPSGNYSGVVEFCFKNK